MDASTRRGAPTSGARAAARTWQHGASTPDPMRLSWRTGASVHITTTRSARPSGSHTPPPCRSGKTGPAARRPARPEGARTSTRQAADGRHRRSRTPRARTCDGQIRGCRRPVPSALRLEAGGAKASRRPTNLPRAAPATHKGSTPGAQLGRWSSPLPGTQTTTPRTGGRGGPGRLQVTRGKPRRSRPAVWRTAPLPAADTRTRWQDRTAAAPREEGRRGRRERAQAHG